MHKHQNKMGGRTDIDYAKRCRNIPTFMPRALIDRRDFMARQITRCVTEKKNCFSYTKMTGAAHGNCRCLDAPVLRDGECPFYKPISPECNSSVIEASISAYKQMHS